MSEVTRSFRFFRILQRTRTDSQPRRRDTVLITGSHGFLGQHVVRFFLDETKCDLVLTARQEQTLYADIAEEPRVLGYHTMDVTQRQQVRDVIQSIRPNMIVNCAAMVDVDLAEKERERAWKTNVSAVEYLAEAARKVDAKIIQVSTDYVFDGTRAPYSEIDPPAPINYYGRTKLASENALKTSGIEHCIIRTGLLYGASEKIDSNFALKVILSLQEGEEFSAATDLYGSPTLADDVALAIVRAQEKDRQGLYHVCGPEMISRHEFATRIARTFALTGDLIKPVVSTDVTAASGFRAPRPMKSAFITLKASTDLQLRLSGVDEGLQVMARGLQELHHPEKTFIYQ